MEYIKNIIKEEVKNKKLFNAIFAKWKEQKANLTPEETENIYNRFSEIQNGLSVKKPQVITFLFRFDGSEGFPKFEAKNLKDISKYTYNEIIFLLNEYAQGEEGFNAGENEEIDNSDFGKVNSHFTDENIEKSRNLWYGNRYSIINEDGFRVYFIPNQRVSIQFGYYLKYANDEIGKTRPMWCVTNYSSNLWSNYRDDRTFYFIIDESKPEDSAYRLAALQRVTGQYEDYKLTTRFNDGDNSKVWEEVVEIFPKIEKFKNLIVPVQFDRTAELNKDTVSIVDMIDERPGRYEFKRQSKDIKRRYIVADRNLSKPESWQSMDNELRILYINKATNGNYRSKFSNYNFLMEVAKVPNEYRSLDHRLQVVGLEGVVTLFDFIMSSEFRLSHTNIDNEGIKIYKSRTNGKSGIFNANTGQWFSKNGITYNPIYSSSAPRIYKYKENPNDKYFVIAYTTNDENKSFYCVIPLSRSRTNGFFLSEESFKNLLNELETENYVKSLSQQPKDVEDIK